MTSAECCKTVHDDHDDQCRNVDDFRVHMRGTCVDSVQCEMSYSQTDIDGRSGMRACTVSRAETRNDASY